MVGVLLREDSYRVSFFGLIDSVQVLYSRASDRDLASHDHACSEQGNSELGCQPKR